MKRIKYYTESQAITALERLQAIGDYPEAVTAEYDYFYINVIESKRDWFTADELKREYDLNGVFEVINNPVCYGDFKIGVDIKEPIITIYGNSLSVDNVDQACTYLEDNIDELKALGFVNVHIGANMDDIDRANAMPSELVLASLKNIVANGGSKITYFDSVLNKNIELI